MPYDNSHFVHRRNRASGGTIPLGPSGGFSMTLPGRSPIGGGGLAPLPGLPADDGPVRDSIDAFQGRIGELDALKGGAAARIQDAQSGARGAASIAAARAGAPSGSIASMQLSNNATLGALDRGLARENDYQRALTQAAISAQGAHAGLELSNRGQRYGRQNDLFGQGLARDRFDFEREQYDYARRQADRDRRGQFALPQLPGGGGGGGGGGGRSGRVNPAGGNPNPFWSAQTPGTNLANERGSRPGGI